MKSGFTIIELLFVIAFSGILITTLFTAFFQINRTLLVAEDIIDFDTRISVMQNQLQKDIMGIFVPIQAIPEPPQAPTTPEEKKKAAAATTTEKKEPKKVLKDVLLSVNKGELLSELTFITNNPVRVYEFAKNAKVKPRIVRVVYRLVPEKEKKGSYTLMRQEGTELDFTQYKPGAKKPVKAYALATGIKSITVEYKMPKKKDEKEKKEKKQEEPIAFETVKEWRFDQLEKEKKIKVKIPQFITLKIVLWDNQQENERTVTFTYNIVGYNEALDLLKKRAIKQEQEKKKAADEKQKKEKEAKEQMVYRRARGRTITLPSVAEIKASVREIISMLN